MEKAFWRFLYGRKCTVLTRLHRCLWCLIKHRDSALRFAGDTTTKLQDSKLRHRIRFPVKGRDSLTHNVMSGSGAPSSRLSNVALSVSIRRLWTPYSVEVTNSWSYITTLPYVFMTWCLIMQRHLTHNTHIWDSTTIRNTPHSYRNTDVFYSLTTPFLWVCFFLISSSH